MKIRYKIVCDMFALLVVNIICYFIFKEKIIYSMIGVFTFAIIIGVMRGKDIVNKLKEKEEKNG